LNEGKFDRGLRDLDDMSLLLRHFGTKPGFFEALVERAAELDLRRPLFYALRYTATLLETPVPADIRNADRLRPPRPALRAFMDLLFEQALRPDHPSCRDGLSGIALWLLYVRAHHLLMPAHILVPHLLRKAYVRRFKEEGRKG
jgi:AcrR family transcriptional regulator